jgi:thiol-disulfide isomerase/thioredoxin
MAVNGFFKYRFECKEPVLLAISPKKVLSFISVRKIWYTPDTKRIYLYVVPGDSIVINAILNEYYMDYSVTGSEICQKICSFQKENRRVDVECFKLGLLMDPEMVKNNLPRIMELNKEMESLRDATRQKVWDFLKNHPDDDFSAYLLLFSGPNTIGPFIKTISSGVRNGIFQKYLLFIENKYKNYMASETVKDNLTGSPAPGFTLSDLDGKSFSLSKLKGKYIVLDFWATWCVPCIKGLPMMKEYAEKYRSKVEFVSIACNDKVEKCRQTVRDNGIKWLQLLNNDTEIPSVSAQYAANYLPKKVIIGTDGKIIATYTGESEDFYNNLDKTLSNLDIR